MEHPFTLSVLEVFNRLDEIEATSGRNDKLDLLTKLLNDDPIITPALYRIGLDPKISTFVATYPDPAKSTTLSEEVWATNLEKLVWEIIRIMSEQSVTGIRQPKALVQEFIYLINKLLPENGAKWMRKAITKDWTLGTSSSSYNAAAKRSKHDLAPIVEFDTVRVSNISDADIDPIGSFCSIKKDGVNGSMFPTEILSRTGNRIWLKHIEEAVPQAIKDKYLIMGEFVSTDRQGSSGLCNSAIASGYNTDKEVHKLQFHIFDILELEEYNSRKFVTPFHERNELMKKVVAEINHPDIVLVEQVLVNSLEEVLTINARLVKEEDEEGIIWNDRSMLFGIFRSTKRARIKECLDADFLIVGVNEHKKKKGTLGSFIIETSCGTLRTSIGSGLTKEQREYFWINQLETVGKVLKGYYNKVIKDSKNKGKYTLFIPVLNQEEIIRMDKDVADSLDMIEWGGKGNPNKLTKV
jgi:hypothetical protein